MIVPITVIIIIIIIIIIVIIIIIIIINIVHCFSGDEEPAVKEKDQSHERPVRKRRV